MALKKINGVMHGYNNITLPQAFGKCNELQVASPSCYSLFITGFEKELKDFMVTV